MLDPYRFGTAGGALVDPATIFAGGDTGGFWDFTDAATLYAEIARTTLASLDEPALGITDKSGKGYHLGGVATVRRTGYVETGISHSLVLQGSLQVGSANGFTAYMAFQVPNLSGPVAIFGADKATSRVAQALRISVTTGNLYCLRFYDNTSSYDDLAQSTGSQIVASTNVYASVEVTPTQINLSINGVVVASTTTASRANSSYTPGFIGLGVDYLGTGSTPAHRMPQTSRLYAALFINRPITTQERTDLNAWFANRAGI